MYNFSQCFNLIWCSNNLLTKIFNLYLVNAGDFGSNCSLNPGPSSLADSSLLFKSNEIYV